MSDKTFVTVNDLELSLKETLGLILLLDGFELRDTMKHYFGILEFAISRNAIPAKDDVQQALDDLRHSFGMERASNFTEWCSQNAINENTLTIVSKINACLKLIKASFQTSELEQEYAEFKNEETRYCLFCLPISEEKLASEIFSKIKEKKISYAEAIQKYGDDEVLSQGGHIGYIPRIELPEEYSKKVLSAAAGDVLSPIEDNGEWCILYLHKIVVPDFQDSEKELRERLFNRYINYHTDRVVVQKAF